MKKNKKLLKTILLGTMCFSLFACANETNNLNMWIVQEGNPISVVSGQEGQMYLDSITYDIYQYTNGEWIKVGNIKGETGNDGQNGEDGKDGANGQNGTNGSTPIIEIINGYWYIDGVNTYVKAEGTSSSIPEEDNVQVKEKVTREEFKSQSADIGSFFMPTSVWRAHIAVDIQIQRGAVITFKGDLNNYRWGVIEIFDVNNSNSSYIDSGWNRTWSNPNASYTTTLDGVNLYLTISKMDTSNKETKFEESEIPGIYDLFEIDAYKGKASDYTSSNGDSGSYISTDNMKSVNHRGACLEAPENTLSAYRKSYKNGFKYVETDVLFTKDNIPVLLHDETIDRTSNGTGKIAELTYAEASKYDYGSWFNDENPSIETDYTGEKLPTFEEFIILCKRLELHPYIELKGNLSFAQANLLIEIVKKCNMLNNVSWISFSTNSLVNILANYSRARVGWVVNTMIDQSKIDIVNTTLKTGNNEAFLDTWYTHATDEVAKLCMNNEIPLEVWTCDDVNAIINLHPYVSGVSSNSLNAAEVLKENA